MTVEDQLRAAGRAVSEQVRDLPRLDLRTQPDPRRAKARASRRWRRASGWLIPVAAAAAVVAVAVTLVAVKSPPRAGDKAAATPAASRSAGPAATPDAVDPEALPGYFVAINGLATTGVNRAQGQSAPDSVVVGETITGKRLATITPPAGATFIGVTGASDDRTFVLDTAQTGSVSGLQLPATQRTWYLLRIKPGATPVTTLTTLSFPLPSAADVDGIALSPDGAKLAVFYQVARKGDGFPYSGPFTLGIYSVATGAAMRTWTDTNPYHGSYGYGSDNGPPDSNDNLTWTSNGQQLAFAFRNSANPNTASLYLKEVNVSGPGGDLSTDSKVVTEIGASPTTGRSQVWCDSLGITGDGKAAVCGATLDVRTSPSAGCAASTTVEYPGLAEISLTGDRLTRMLYDAEPKCAGGGYGAVLWSSPSGDTVLGSVSYLDDPPGPEHQAVVLYRHGTVTTVNWPGAVSTLLANQAAF